MGGVWTKLTDKFLVGAGSTYALGATGGEATHTLSLAEMPAHAHNVNIMSGASGGSTANGYVPWGNGRSGSAYATNQLGASAAHNNLPPYQAVYMWQRIS